MKLFSAVKPEVSNMFTAKCYKARTITRWLLFIIFLENTAINICMLSVLFFSILKLFFFRFVFGFFFCYCLFGLHFSGWDNTVSFY